MPASKRVTPKNWSDPDDAPELSDAFFERADEHRNQALIKRGRPKAAATKEPVKLRLDPDVVDALRATGRNQQTNQTATAQGKHGQEQCPADRQDQVENILPGDFADHPRNRSWTRPSGL